MSSVTSRAQNRVMDRVSRGPLLGRPVEGAKRTCGRGERAFARRLQQDGIWTDCNTDSSAPSCRIKRSAGNPSLSTQHRWLLGNCFEVFAPHPNEVGQVALESDSGRPSSHGLRTVNQPDWVLCSSVFVRWEPRPGSTTEFRRTSTSSEPSVK